jgi:HEAT repeat protein
MEVPSWGKSPRDSIERECERRGQDKVIAGCMALLQGRSVDAELIYALGGPPARWVFTGTEPGPDYWLRVWAARGLLWAWDETALSCIMTALKDEAWRVREMALKVVGRHRLADALTTVESMRDDPNSRVASAANRALAQLTESPEGRERTE